MPCVTIAILAHLIDLFIFRNRDSGFVILDSYAFRFQLHVRARSTRVTYLLAKLAGPIIYPDLELLLTPLYFKLRPQIMEIILLATSASALKLSKLWKEYY
jgi:hypothetical protein